MDFMNKQDLAQLFEVSFPFWQKLSEQDKDTLFRSSQKVSFGKGATIHNGTNCTGVILIKTGSLRLYILSEDGKEITLYRLCADTTFCSNIGVVHHLTIGQRRHLQKSLETT